MEKGKTLLRWTGVLATVAVVSVLGLTAQGAVPAGGEPHADAVVIDTLRAFGDLERPPVVFFHDAHTNALEKKGKDCAACHLKGKEDRLSQKYMRLEDTGRKAVMDIYHQNCIACHAENRKAGEKGGPVACGECHKPRVEMTDVRQPMGFDKSLHFRHAKAMENKCERCHHEYDAATKQLVYAKGKEGTCRYCHKEVTEENRSSFRLAAHTGCLSCHRDLKAKNQKTGPFQCAGCHDPAAQAAVEKVPEIPRMERNQPDAVFVKKLPKEAVPPATPVEPVQAGVVPFNHKGHEAYNDNCRVCHHAAMTACSECHTVTGDKKGDFVKLADAMHRIGTDASCLGCHEKRQSDKSCAGCHAPIPRTRTRSPESCKSCHVTPDAPVVMADNAAAATLLAARTPMTGTYAESEIPEKVVIKSLSKEYEPAEMPHRKIVLALVKNISENKLAQSFHLEKGTVCQGCHHNTPASAKPPQCASCHGKPFDPQNLYRPGLYGAYHQQCMGCHQEMKIEKAMGCTDCHKEKNL